MKTKTRVFFLGLGVGGFAILISLGYWQLQRLSQKEALIGEIERRASAAPVPLPRDITEKDNFLRVEFEGVLDGSEAHVLSSRKILGPGFQIVASMKTGPRDIMVDLGFVREAEKNERRLGAVKVLGTVFFPNDIDPKFTPDPDLEKNIFFARDLPRMSEFLNSEPVLIVATQLTPDLGTKSAPPHHNLPNNHLQYAITWFSLALVWLSMTVYALYVRSPRN